MFRQRKRKWGRSARAGVLGKERGTRPGSSEVCKAGSQDSTKGFIDNTHESEWPQVNHFSFSQPLHFEAAPSRSRTSCHTKGLCGQSPVDSFPVHSGGPFLQSLTAHTTPLHPLEGLQPCRKGESHPPEHCRQRERTPPKNMALLDKSRRPLKSASMILHKTCWCDRLMAQSPQLKYLRGL